ncbi:hypothetical protein AB0942_09900 [Streptomyces nodosus]|uniref:hypothetical protein n=1 Tax=Streptomyces nodosus TaxID=40318 RepID=UPI00345344CA
MTQPELPGYENPELRYAWVRPNQLSPKLGGGRHDLYWTGHRTWTTLDLQAPRTFDSAQDADDALAAEYGPRPTWPDYLRAVLRDLQLTRVRADSTP